LGLPTTVVARPFLTLAQINDVLEHVHLRKGRCRWLIGILALAPPGIFQAKGQQVLAVALRVDVRLPLAHCQNKLLNDISKIVYVHRLGEMLLKSGGNDLFLRGFFNIGS
jgi:hypothetical protein